MPIDTTREIDELQNRLWMERSVDERAEFMFGMFATSRKILVSSLPSGLTDRQLKEQVYFRTYGESLPLDFFKDDRK